MVRLVWPGWWLGLLVGAESPVAAQANVIPPRVELKENYPNPFFPATTIRFTINSEICARGHQPVVSLKVHTDARHRLERESGQSAPAMRSVPSLLGREVPGRQARGHHRGVLLPAYSRWRAIHQKDDRSAEGPQPAVKYEGAVHQAAIFSLPWSWFCDAPSLPNRQSWRVRPLPFPGAILRFQ